MSTVLNGIAPLPHWGVIRAEGEEAAKFLHAQLTQDFVLMGPSEARLAAFCSAKGRMLATFIGVKRSQGDILLVCNRDLLPATLKRLSMFVLRAKVKLSDATDAFQLRGLAGTAVAGTAGAEDAPWTQRDLGHAQVVYLYPALGAARALWIGAAGLPAPQGDALTTEDWLYGEVLSGVPMVSAPTAEAFVPQMLNYESVDGVNFKKGCYPGQEVVARSQFRGTLKRRAFLARSAAPMSAGQEIFPAGDDTADPCAIVVQAARAPQGGFAAIVSGQIAALQGQGLRLGSANGAAVSIEPVPYPLRDDI